jgi:hypothetical protein
VRRGAQAKAKAIETTLVAWLRHEGTVSVRVASAAAPGFPHRLILLPGGRPLLLCFKKPGGRLSQLELKWFQRLCELNYSVQVVDDVEYGKAIVREMRTALAPWDGVSRIV